MQFKRAAGSKIKVRLTAEEARVLGRLIGELRSLLEAGAKDDPVEGRLFPAAYESDEDAGEYRSMVEDDLRRGKLESLDAVEGVLDAAGKVNTVLTPDQVDAWLTVLTDLRLAIGTRLEVTEEAMSKDVDPDDPRAPTMSLLHWLGWTQEMLLEEIQPGG